MSLKKDLLKYEPRKEQKECLDFIDSEYKKNKENKFFLLDLPVGSGKSHLALMIADWYLKTVNGNAKFDVITNSKILQDQYVDTYDSINDLKGKENYECEQYSCSCAQGNEFNRLNKTSCEACPHSFARDSYINGRVSLTNFYLYTLYQLYMTKMMESRGANVLIVDECLHPDTEITLYDETTKKIKDIEIGDLVKTINEESGDIEIKPVVKLHHNLNKGKQMYEIEMDNGDILKITGNHKVKLLDGSWIKVEDLKEEDEILYINEKMKSHEFDNNRKEYNI
jgi:Rad3-related DNA helicase